MELIIHSAGDGAWTVVDAARRLPASVYDDLEGAEADARRFLAAHGGGPLIVRPAGDEIRTYDVAPAPAGAPAPSADRAAQAGAPRRAPAVPGSGARARGPRARTARARGPRA